MWKMPLPRLGSLLEIRLVICLGLAAFWAAAPARAEFLETRAVTETGDACLVGSWLADQGELGRVIYDMVPASVENVEVAGNFGVKFNADGTAVFGFYKLRVKLNYATGVPTTGIDVGGSIDNLWSTDARRLQMGYAGPKAAIQIVMPRSASKDPKTGKMTPPLNRSDQLCRSADADIGPV